MHRILVLGGYGTFGKRICESLAGHADYHLIIAGRHAEQAERLCTELEGRFSQCRVEPKSIDIAGPLFASHLKSLKPDIVIHTCGPFQGQDYHVPQACIDAGAHYIDLADDRRFVCDITRLDEDAKKQKVLVVSGASSVPGLSSVVLDALCKKLKQINEIDFSIAPGNQAERGLATVKAILSYTGHPFKSWVDGAWRDVYGWMNNRVEDYGKPVGRRLLANVDIPDLTLFPERYKPVHTVRFQAGLELGILHHSMRLMAWMAKHRLIKNWARYAKPILSLSHFFKPFGSDCGAMRVMLRGQDKKKKPVRYVWTLVARDGVGPYIPTLSAIILVQQLTEGRLKTRGALPCLGLYSLDEFTELAESWGIYHTLDTFYD